jgi:hypothetical protein
MANGELKQKVRQPDVDMFYDSFSEVSKTYAWADGTTIWMSTPAGYQAYVFQRTDDRKPDGGQWLTQTGVITGIAATW